MGGFPRVRILLVFSGSIRRWGSFGLSYCIQLSR